MAQHRKSEARILEILRVGRRWQERARNKHHHGLLAGREEMGNWGRTGPWVGSGVRAKVAHQPEQGSQNRRVCRC